MAALILKVPHETGRLLTSLDVPGNKVPTDELHITLLCFEGDPTPIEEISKATVATYEVTSRWNPFTVVSKKISSFPQNKETGLYPTILLMESPELMDFQARLRVSLDRAGVEYSKKFPSYVPHVTLSYSTTAPKEKDLALTWAAYEAVLWGGDKGDDRLSISFPFTLNSNNRSALNRGMVQLAMRSNTRK